MRGRRHSVTGTGTCREFFFLCRGCDAAPDVASNCSFNNRRELMRLDHQRLDYIYFVEKGVETVSDYGVGLINGVSLQDRGIKVAFDHSLGSSERITKQMY